MIQDKSNQEYKKIEDKMCKTIKGLRKRDIDEAKETCEGRTDCTGIVNFKCNDKRYKLCKSSRFRPSKRGHCILQKQQGMNLQNI